MIGMVLAWNLFGPAADWLYRGAIHVLYPGSF
jgi:hypothetical protein